MEGVTEKLEIAIERVYLWDMFPWPKEKKSVYLPGPAK
jgi:hypothetical protein